MLQLPLRRCIRQALGSSPRFISTHFDPEIYLEPSHTKLPEHFNFIPNFLNHAEQCVLLHSALRKLDEVGSRESKRRRKWNKIPDGNISDINALFFPDEFYDFEEGHYDGVITKYRETHVTSWIPHLGLENILLRLRSLLPSNLQGDVQTHILHLESRGSILPHIDNTEASGSCIAAISLGGERILRMENTADLSRSFDILLPSGSAYVQRDTVRYSYEHSILPGGVAFKGKIVPQSQRISVMLRDCLRKKDPIKRKDVFSQLD